MEPVCLIYLKKVTFGQGLDNYEVNSSKRKISKMHEMHSISFRFSFSFSGGGKGVPLARAAAPRTSSSLDSRVVIIRVGKSGGCEALLMPDLRIPDGINPRAVGG